MIKFKPITFWANKCWGKTRPRRYCSTRTRTQNLVVCGQTNQWHHYDDVIMGTIASQITSLPSVYSTVYSGADQSKHQSSASLAFVWGIHRGPVNSPHKWPVTRKMVPFDDVIMTGKFPSLRLVNAPEELWQFHSMMSSHWRKQQSFCGQIYILWVYCVGKFPAHRDCGNITGGERTRVSADTLVKMAEDHLAHRTGLLWLSDFASILSSCKWCIS